LQRAGEQAICGQLPAIEQVVVEREVVEVGLGLLGRECFDRLAIDPQLGVIPVQLLEAS
jgi:hypothetical protein